MNRKAAYALGGLLLVAFAGFSLTSFQASLTQYVSYDKARAASRTVQVAGGLEKETSSYDSAAEALLFTIKEPESGDTMRVRYHGLKPANFEDAVSVVAIGRYDGQQSEFLADKLLVKCPSKYQGDEVEKIYS